MKSTSSRKISYNKNRYKIYRSSKKGAYGHIIYKGEAKVVKPSKMYEFKYERNCKSCLETLYDSKYNR